MLLPVHLSVMHALQRGLRRVRYMHIFEDSVISLGIFQLPMGASIPLHDHPGMTVISRCSLPPR